MIIKGNTRKGGPYLVAHMLNARDNDHVDVHELRGFASENLTDAVCEVDALSKGTNCKKPWFSTSLNPPMDAEVKEHDYLRAIEQCEEKLGFAGQPRAVIFHEKEGRQHCHVIWSRIDPETMNTIPDSFSRLKLQEVSKSLYLEHGWALPPGFEDRNKSQPEISLADQAVAKRSGLTNEDHEQLIQHAWEKSDSAQSFASALEDQGYILAQGKRGAIAVDIETQDVHFIARRLGLKNKQVEAKLGPLSDLPNVEEAKKQAGAQQQAKSEFDKNAQQKEDRYQKQLEALKNQQTLERQELFERQWDEKARQERSFVLRLEDRLKSFWDISAAEFSRLKDKFLGKDNEAYHQARIVELRKNQEQRFSDERDQLKQKQIRQRRELQRPLQAERHVNRQALIAVRQSQRQRQAVADKKAEIQAKLERDRLKGRKLER